MLHTLISLVAFASAAPAASSPPLTQTMAIQSAAVASTTPKVDRFEGRPRARIAFAREVRNFQVKRDGYDDVLYLETRRDRWFRSEINCFGIEDPRDAQGLVPIGHDFGFDRFSRVALVGFGHRTTQCQLGELVELTPQEAVELRLVRPRRGAPAAAVPVTPAS